MKKIFFTAITFLLICTFVPDQLNAAAGLVATEPVADSTLTKEALLNRLNEIKSSDRSSMTHAEKKQINQEAGEIREALHNNYGGVYISVGALLLIILILIILL